MIVDDKGKGLANGDVFVGDGLALAINADSASSDNRLRQTARFGEAEEPEQLV